MVQTESVLIEEPFVTIEKKKKKKVVRRSFVPQDELKEKNEVEKG